MLISIISSASWTLHMDRYWLALCFCLLSNLLSRLFPEGGLFFPARACKWCTFLLSATFSTSCLNQKHISIGCIHVVSVSWTVDIWRSEGFLRSSKLSQWLIPIWRLQKGAVYCYIKPVFLRHMWILIDDKLYKLRQAGGFQQPQMTSALCIIYTLVVGSCLSCAWQKACICSLFCMKLKQM